MTSISLIHVKLFFGKIQLLGNNIFCEKPARNLSLWPIVSLETDPPCLGLAGYQWSDEEDEKNGSFNWGEGTQTNTEEYEE